MQRRLSVGIIW